MKKLILFSTILLATTMFKTADAQVSIRVNIGNQPVWGPVGYDYVDYYYFPEVDMYYNVPQGQYIFFDGRRWVSTYALPSRYSNFDLFRSYKVVINEPDPFRRNDYYHNRYSNYRGQLQPIIFNSRDPRYYVIEQHPEHSRWIESRRSLDYSRNSRRDMYEDRGRFDNNDYNRAYNDRDYNRAFNRQYNNDAFDNRRFNNDNNRTYNKFPDRSNSVRENDRRPIFNPGNSNDREGRPNRRF